MDANGDSSKVSERNGDHVIGNWGKDDPCYKITKNLTELYSSVLVELARDDLGCLAEISNQNIEGEGALWVL